MTHAPDDLRRLRKDFDETFAHPLPDKAPETEDLLALRAGGTGHALRAREITGLYAGRKIVPVPGRATAFLGLAGVAGRLVPVWDLAALLGGAARGAPRWMVVAAGEDPWALAFDAFEGYVRVPRAEVREGGAGPAVCRLAGTARPLLRLPSLWETLRQRSQSESTRRTSA